MLKRKSKGSGQRGFPVWMGRRKDHDGGRGSPSIETGIVLTSMLIRLLYLYVVSSVVSLFSRSFFQYPSGATIKSKYRLRSGFI